MVSAPKVICLGEALVDRLGPLGKDPYAASLDQCDDKLGGAPANVACALGRLGIPTAFVGRLGVDEIGDSFVKLFNSRSVDLSGLQMDYLRPTRIVLVRRTFEGERFFQGFAGDLGSGFSDQALSLSDLKLSWPSLSSNAEWLYVGTIPLASPLSSECLLWALDRCHEGGIRIALDVNWRSSFWGCNFDSISGDHVRDLRSMQILLSSVSLLKLAKEEAQWLFGTFVPSDISSGLPQHPDVVVTDGANPVHWHISGNSGVINVFSPPRVVDTTGAGDAFCAGLLHQLIHKNHDPHKYEQIFRFAAGCGAVVCGGAGAIDPQPNASLIRKLFDC